MPHIYTKNCSTDTTENEISLPDPSRFPTVEHRVRFRPLSGYWSLHPHYGDRQDASDGAEEADRPSDAPMGSSEDHICRTDARNPDMRAPRGFNGLPKAGKELVVDGTVLLHELSRSLKFDLVCWTVTLPSAFSDGTSFTREDYRRFLRGWPDFTRWVMEELARDLERQGLPNRWLYVIEPQEERWRLHNVLAPHIHAVIPNRMIPTKRNPHKDKGFGVTGYWALTTEDLDDIISRCAARVMGRAVDCRSAGNVQKIHGAGKVGQYLSKFNKIGRYFSKGSRIMGEIQESEWSDCIPCNWYGSDFETRQQVRDSVEKFSVGDGSLFQAAIAVGAVNDLWERETGKPLFANVHTHWVTPDGVPVPYGEPVPDDAIPVAMTGKVNYLRDIELGEDILRGIELHQIPIPIPEPESS